MAPKTILNVDNPDDHAAILAILVDAGVLEWEPVPGTPWQRHLVSTERTEQEG